MIPVTTPTVTELLRAQLAAAANEFAAAGADRVLRDVAEREVVRFAGALAGMVVGFADVPLWERTRDRLADGALDSALS